MRRSQEDIEEENIEVTNANRYKYWKWYFFDSECSNFLFLEMTGRNYRGYMRAVRGVSVIELLRMKFGPMSNGARLHPEQQEQQETSRALFQGSSEGRKTGDSSWIADNAIARKGCNCMVWGWVVLMTKKMEVMDMKKRGEQESEQPAA